MATEVATLTARLEADIRDFDRDMRRAEKRLEGLENQSRQTGNAGRGMADSFNAAKLAIAAFVGAAAVRKAITFGKDLVDSYSDLQESANAVNVVFGEAADTITDFGRKSAKAVGLAQSEFQQLSVVTGALLKNFGYDAEGAAENTLMLTQRASDLASVFNTDVKDALGAINAALRGETEAIRRYAIDVSGASLAQFALSKGIEKSVDEMTQSEKVALRLEAIMEQSADTAGDFAATSEDLANKQRILNAEWEDAKAVMGEELAPIMAQFLEWFSKGLPTAVRIFTDALDTGVQFLQDFVAGGQAIISFFGELLPGESEKAVIAIGLVGVALAALYAHPVIAGLALVAWGVGEIGRRAREEAAHIASLQADLDEMGTISFANIEDALGADTARTLLELGFSVDDLKRAIVGTDAEALAFQRTLKELEGAGLLDDVLWGYVLGKTKELREEWRGAKADYDAMQPQGMLFEIDPGGGPILHGLRETSESLAESMIDYESWKHSVTNSQRAAEQEIRKSASEIVSVWDEVPEQIELSVDEMKRILLESATAAARYEDVMIEMQRRGFGALMAQLDEAGPEYTAAFEALMAVGGTQAGSAFWTNLQLELSSMSPAEALDTSDIAEMGYWLGEIAGLNANSGFASTFSPGSGGGGGGGGQGGTGSSSGGGGLNVPNKFASGGIVPGPLGAPRLAVVHGGEEVLTPEQRIDRSVTINMNGNMTTSGNVQDELTMSLLTAGVNEHAQFQGISDIR